MKKIFNKYYNRYKVFIQILLYCFIYYACGILLQAQSTTLNIIGFILFCVTTIEISLKLLK